MNLCILGKTGQCVLDENGDREPDYWIMDMNADGIFVVQAQTLTLDDGSKVIKLIEVTDILHNVHLNNK